MNEEQKLYSIALDMVLPLTQHPFEVVDGDTGNVLSVTLTNGGTAVDLTGKYVCVIFRSGAGTFMQDDTNGLTVGAQAGVFTVALLPAAFGPGDVSADVQVYSGTDNATLITSMRFTFRCRNALLNSKTMAAQAAYPPLVTATHGATVASDAANAAATLAGTNAGLAQAAAEAASVAADAAQTKGALAETAAGTASAAAGTAAQKADLAETAAGAATAAADAAMQQAALAQSAASAAGAAASAAAAAAAQALSGAQADWNETDGTKGAFIRNKPAGPAALSVSLPVSGWSGNAQTVSVPGVTAQSNIIVTPAPACYVAWSNALVYACAQGEGTVTFCCRTAPSANLTANLLRIGG